MDAAFANTLLPDTNLPSSALLCGLLHFPDAAQSGLFFRPARSDPDSFCTQRFQSGASLCSLRDDTSRSWQSENETSRNHELPAGGAGLVGSNSVNAVKCLGADQERARNMLSPQLLSPAASYVEGLTQETGRDVRVHPMDQYGTWAESHTPPGLADAVAPCSNNLLSMQECLSKPMKTEMSDPVWSGLSGMEVPSSAPLVTQQDCLPKMEKVEENLSYGWTPQSSQELATTVHGFSGWRTGIRPMIFETPHYATDLLFNSGFVNHSDTSTRLNDKTDSESVLATLHTVEGSLTQKAAHQVDISQIVNCLSRTSSCPRISAEVGHHEKESMSASTNSAHQVPLDISTMVAAGYNVDPKMENTKLCRAFSWPRPVSQVKGTQVDDSDPLSMGSDQGTSGDLASSPEKRGDASSTQSRETMHKRKARQCTESAIGHLSAVYTDPGEVKTANLDEKFKKCKVEDSVDEDCVTSVKKEQSHADFSKPCSKKQPKAKAIEVPKDVIHVRARRGQATDSHSLAERVRREKISERMKLLQDLVPGCNKVLGKAMILDEIINYVQSLQRQVEFLSMRLAATAHGRNIESASNDFLPIEVRSMDCGETALDLQRNETNGIQNKRHWLQHLTKPTELLQKTKVAVQELEMDGSASSGTNVGPISTDFSVPSHLLLANRSSNRPFRM